MIDPVLSIAFSMHSNKGVYALLLGSGISRAAGIPTGWEIVLDLTRKLAQMQGESCEPDPAAWYLGKYGKDPDYSDLLDSLAKSSAERRNLLRQYFEPTDEEAQQGLKMPTKAHRAIAKLAVSGYVRVILTTNFDRLMERALEEAGLAPTVASSPDAIEGTIPLVHSQFTLFKLHGDYLDTRLKNTEEELAAYDPRVNHLLERVFDEYGLVVCGWSAEWDIALRQAIEKCPTRRFSSFWAYQVKPKETLRKLAEFRQGQLIRIQSADEFFTNIYENISALENYGAKHPLSVDVGIARIKKYIADDKYKILLFDLLNDESEALYRELETEFSQKKLDATGSPFSPMELQARVARYGELTKVLLNMMIHASYWSGDTHLQLWERIMSRISDPPGGQSGLVVWLKLRRYPALLLFYGAGIAALSSRNYLTLRSLYFASVRDDSSTTTQLILRVLPQNIMDPDVANKLPELDRRHTPVSDLLFGALREPLRPLLPNDSDYEEMFDEFEYLSAIQYGALAKSGWFPWGCYAWRGLMQRRTIADKVSAEVLSQQDGWPAFKAGLFGGSYAEFTVLQKRLAEFIAQLRLF